MRTLLAIALSLSLPAAAVGAQSQAPASTAAVAASSAADVETSTANVLFSFPGITVTAPREGPELDRDLKIARAGGVGAAAGGLGIFAYSVIFGAAGPIGWAAALIFFGGMTAYISHRTLHGHDDFSPDEARRSARAGKPAKP